MSDEALSVENYEEFKAALNTDAKEIDVSKLPFAQACRASIEAGWKGKRVGEWKGKGADVEPRGKAEGAGDECRLVCKSCGAAGIVRPKAKPFGCFRVFMYVVGFLIGLNNGPVASLVLIVLVLDLWLRHRRSVLVCPKCGGHDLVSEKSPIGETLVSANGVAQCGQEVKSKAKMDSTMGKGAPNPVSNVQEKTKDIPSVVNEDKTTEERKKYGEEVLRVVDAYSKSLKGSEKENEQRVAKQRGRLLKVIRKLDSIRAELILLERRIARHSSDVVAFKRRHQGDLRSGEQLFAGGDFEQYLSEKKFAVKMANLEYRLGECKRCCGIALRAYQNERESVGLKDIPFFYFYPHSAKNDALKKECDLLSSILESDNSRNEPVDDACVALQRWMNGKGSLYSSDGIELKVGESILGRWECDFYKVRTHTTTIRHSKENSFLWLVTAESLSDLAASSRTLDRSQRFYLESNGTLYCTNEKVLFVGGTATRKVEWKNVVKIEFDYDEGRVLIHSSNYQAPSLFIGVDARQLDMLRTFLRNATMRNNLAAMPQSEVIPYVTNAFKAKKTIALEMNV